MQKKVIVLAIAAALTAPAVALADAANVTPYGVANLSFDRISTGTTAAGASGVSKMVVSSNVSHFGLKGSEDLGGLTGVWQIESEVNMDGSGTSTLGTRNTFIGLAGGFGTVLLGKHDTPYKLSTRGLDVFADTIADNRSLMGSAAVASFDGRQPDVLAYVSPAFSGVTAIIARVNLSEDLAQAATTTTVASSTIGAISAAALYGAGPISASLAYETHNIDAFGAPAISEKATKIGVGFTQDAFSVGVAYEKITDEGMAVLNTLLPAVNPSGHTSIYVGGKFNLPGGAVKAAITKSGEKGNVAKTDASQIAFGYDHNLSKRTTVYALYTKLSNGDAAANGLSSAASTAGATSVAGAGASPSALSFGMKHSF